MLWVVWTFDVEKGNPNALLEGIEAGAATVENGMEFPKIF